MSTEDAKKHEENIKAMRARVNQKPLKPVVVYKKSSGEISYVLFSSKIIEIQRIDSRTHALLELEDTVIPKNIRELIVINGILKDKPKDVLNAMKRQGLESRLVVLEMQIEVAKKKKLTEAAKRYSVLIKEINKQIADLGVD